MADLTTKISLNQKLQTPNDELSRKLSEVVEAMNRVWPKRTTSGEPPDYLCSPIDHLGYQNYLVNNWDTPSEHLKPYEIQLSPTLVSPQSSDSKLVTPQIANSELIMADTTSKFNFQDYSVPFSGSAPYEFIQGYEEFFKVNPMTEIDMIQYVMQDFEGEELEWYYEYVEENFVDTWTPDCWEDFIIELYRKFAGEHQLFVERSETEMVKVSESKFVGDEPSEVVHNLFARMHEPVKIIEQEIIREKFVEDEGVLSKINWEFNFLQTMVEYVNLHQVLRCDFDLWNYRLSKGLNFGFDPGDLSKWVKFLWSNPHILIKKFQYGFNNSKCSVRSCGIKFLDYYCLCGFDTMETDVAIGIDQRLQVQGHVNKYGLGFKHCSFLFQWFLIQTLSVWEYCYIAFDDLLFECLPEMVLKKRQEYGFYGYQVPVILRGPRSLRRGSKKKSVDDSLNCAFELLAAVAGKLWQESKSFASSNASEGKEQFGIHKDVIKKEQLEEKAVRSEYLDQGSRIDSVLVPESADLERDSKSTLKKLPHVENDYAFERISVITSSDFLKKVGGDVKFEKSATNNAAGSLLSKSEGIFHGDGQLYDGKLSDEAERQVKLVGKQTGHLDVANTSGSKDPMELYVNNTHMLINSESRVKSPMYRDHIPSASSLRCRNDVKIVNRDDDEMKGDKSGLSSLGIGHKASFQTTDPCVKLSIKSFKVLELYIEVPETATVGSLKRTVMEAVTAILGGGLHVGVVLQVKKVRDDNRTLQQTGISQNEDLDTLGFTLELNFVQAASPLSHKDPPLLLPCDTHEQLSRSPVPILDSGVSNSSIEQAPVTNLDNHDESSREIVHFLTEVSTERTMLDSKALVAIPPLNIKALAMVPMNQEAKRSDLSQRRTRRSFSVSEVEELVEAVEKLGTGRWRDVKLCAFGDANHRTYVDLKDHILRMDGKAEIYTSRSCGDGDEISLDHHWKAEEAALLARVKDAMNLQCIAGILHASKLGDGSENQP